MMYQKKKIHFIGIGGIGMSAIAEILHEKGFKISGSDISNNSITKRLRKRGIKIFFKHSWRNLGDSDVAVYTSAIKKNNEELKFAKSRKIPVLSRASILAEVMRLKPSITIAGSHGKTSTTSLLASILEFSNFDPTIINGGIINSIKANAKLGKGDWIIAEADESDGSFKCLPSTIGIINNIDLEHIDYYKNIREVKDAFLEYSKHIPFYGFLSLCIDHKNVRELKNKLFDKKVITFGLNKKANFSATNIKLIEIKKNIYSQFDLVVNFKKKIVTKNIIAPLIGKHNIQNILGAISVAKTIGVNDSQIKKSIKNYQGVKRRFSILYKNKNNMLVDDYAHHPKEIITTLTSMKEVTQNRLISIFEPHRYSRIAGFLEEFIQSFKKSDYIFVLPIYGAGENNPRRISNIKIVSKMKKELKKINIFAIQNEKELITNLTKIIKDGDNIIFLGAGNSSKIAENFSQTLKKNA